MSRECYVSCDVREGLHPSELTVYIQTVAGHAEEVSVSKEEVQHRGSFGMGLLVWRIGSEGSRTLIELSRETSTGFWRLWVSSAHLTS